MKPATTAHANMITECAENAMIIAISFKLETINVMRNVIQHLASMTTFSVVNALIPYCITIFVINRVMFLNVIMILGCVMNVVQGAIPVILVMVYVMTYAIITVVSLIEGTAIVIVHNIN